MKTRMTDKAKTKATELLKQWNITGVYKNGKIFFYAPDISMLSKSYKKREYYLAQINNTTLGSFVGQELRNVFEI